MLIRPTTNVILKKSVLIVEVPKSLTSEDVLSALYATRIHSIAAERRGYSINIADVSTILMLDSEIDAQVKMKRQRLLEMLAGQVFSVVYYSGSGLCTEYLRAIVQAAHAGDTPIRVTFPQKSPLARYIKSFRFGDVTRVE